MLKKIKNFMPFLDDLKNYNSKKLRMDVIAALTVAVIIIPQAIADAMIADIHPKYGLYASILPVIVAALFSSSRFMNNGPTGEVSMLFASSFGAIAVGGTALSQMPDAQKIPFLFLLTFLVGVVQIVMGFGKMGNLSNFVSKAVLTGFITGAGILTAVNQLKNLFGIKLPHGGNVFSILVQNIENISNTNIYAFAVGIGAIVLVVLFQKFAKKVPSYLVAMIITGFMAFYFDLKSKGISFVEDIPQSLPPFSFPNIFDLSAINSMLSLAIAIALLAVLGALSIAKSIADKTGEEIDSNQELIAQGFSNVFGSFTSSMPGAGALTRTSANYSAGAETRLSGVFCGLVVLLSVLLFARFTSYIPKAALAGILMVVAYKMVDYKAFMFNYHSTKSDRAVLLTTVIATLFLTMDKAIYVGVAVAIILYLRKTSTPDIFEVVPRESDGKLVPVTDEDFHCPNISIQQIEGPIFFASSGAFIKKILRKERERVVILRMKQVRIIDATGAHALKKIIDTCHNNKIGVILSGVKPKVIEVLEKTKVIDSIGRDHIVRDATEAINLAFDKYVDKDLCKVCAKNLFKECANSK